MSTFYEEGGEAIMHFALGLDCPEEKLFQTIIDPEFEGSTRGGSDNLDLLANIPAWIWPRHVLDEMNLSKGIEKNLQLERTRFQRNEILSVPYSIIHLVTRLAAYRHAKKRGYDPHEKLFREWLENFWSLCRLTEHRVNGRDYLCFAGERSSGYPHPNWFGTHMAWGIATGSFNLSGTKEEAWANQIKKDRRVTEVVTEGGWWYHTNSWIDVALVGFEQEIRETASKFLTCSIPEVVQRSPKLVFREPVFIYRTTDGVAQWWGEAGERASHNGNTGPIGCIKGESGRVVTCPPDGGPKWRQKASSLSTKLQDDLTTVKVTWPEIDYIGEMLLPKGEIVAFWRIDPARGWVDLMRGDVPVEDWNSNGAREYDEATGLLVHMFKPVFEELNESNTTEAERAYLTSELQEMANRWKKPSQSAKKPWWKF